MRPADTLLLVDDEPSLRLLCRVNLELEGYRVLEAETLEEARAILRSEPVSVVLLDVHLKGERGLDLVEDVRSATPPGAIVLLTGESAIDGEDRHAVDAVLPKPFSLEELSATVGRLAGR